jgi:S1-C subfamily serine protease
MTLMFRPFVLVAFLFAVPGAAGFQAPSVLHIKVVLMDAERKATPVPNHALLISDNPPTATPRRVVTALDGTVDVRLSPGKYTVESDLPMAFQGKAYQWTKFVTIVAGRDAALELTAENAEVGPLASVTTTSAAASDADFMSLLTRWQDSVVALWMPTTHASGFVIGANGLVVTNQRVIGTATAVEVQLSATVKVAARILAADRERDVAVLWIDPQVTAAVRPVPLECAQVAQAAKLGEGQEVFTIGIPLRQQKGPAFGTVSGVEAHTIGSDLIIPTGSAGGPVFTSGGSVVGVTSVTDDRADQQRGNVRIVRVSDVCDVVAGAEKKMKDAAAPIGTHLPIEPERQFPLDALKEAALRRAGSLNPYQISSLDFDIALMTPVQIYGAQYLSEQMNGRDRNKSARPTDAEPAFVRPLLEFNNWSEYIAEYRTALLIRVTPKLVEGLWTKVARGAAQTQGVALPAFKRAKSGFLRMQAFCGEAEVAPIHPFRLEQHVSETDVVYEGLYVFDPDALGPSCGSVRLTLYSEKEPGKGDTRVVDAKVVQQIWQDFAPYRALK